MPTTIPALQIHDETPHWRVSYDEDGEPIGEVCRCDIGEDHKVSGVLL